MLNTLTRYKVIEKLGAGGMGEVYKADDLRLMRTVAIKIVLKQGRAAPDAELRFLREARISSAMNHPNIVTIHEIGEAEDFAYIVMEYVKGRSLREMIKARSFTAGQIMSVSSQVCDALIEAHSQGIVHRDIKPENILITDRDLVKVLDFGLAKTIKTIETDPDGDTAIRSLTQSGAILGTLAYMSPEQLRGRQLDERTDIFSFGIVLYEMLAGRLPFAGKNSFEVAASILKEDAIKLAAFPAGMPAGVGAIVMRCLEKETGRRYSSFAEIKRELAALGSDRNPAAIMIEPTVELPQAGIGRQVSPGPPSAPQTSRPALPTIFVLPLDVVGSQEDISFIGIGLAYAITTNLAKITGLSVLSKSVGAGRIDERGREGRDIARELGATILLEGEVIRHGQMIEVMARLTDAESGRVVWGDQYRGQLSDLFSIQDAVCENIAAALKVSISSDIRDQIARPATTNIAAFEFYSKGRAYLERRDVKENIEFAIQMFQEALRIDPDFTLAHAGLCEMYWQMYFQKAHDAVWVERAIAAGDRALVLDPYQAEVHISLGIVYNGTGNIERAVEEFERAIELQPLNSDAYRWLGRCYQRKGEEKLAVEHFQKAIKLRPGYWETYYMLGICYYIFGRYREAAEQFRKLITIQPDNYHGYDKLGAIYCLLGQYEDAVAMHKRAININPNFEAYSNLGTDLFYLGRFEEAIEAYAAAINLNPRDDVLYRNLGDTYLRLGRGEDAKEQFAKASECLSERLSVETDQAELLGRLAINQAKLGQAQEALSNIEQAISLEPRNTMLMYLRAVVNALTGHTDQAIEYLSQALAHGYSRSEAENDPDLEALRGRAKYKSLFRSEGEET